DKSTVAEIRDRFDNDVERFSNLETGQVAAKGSLERMSLVAEAAVATTPALLADDASLCDIGCGAGNYTLRLLQEITAAGGHPAHLSMTLIDLSRPMLDRAVERLTQAGIASHRITPIQADIRDVELGVARFDTILAAASLHHLRGDDEWQAVFNAMGHATRPGGSCWVSDSVEHESPGVARVMDRRWAAYLESVDGPAYRDKVMTYVVEEDTPRPLGYQLDLLRCAGFDHVDVLTADTRFAAFGGVKSSTATADSNA
ncbi:MAG: class I SAM-dependent methyltransferase, partial [Planctomycetota bacterium]